MTTTEAPNKFDEIASNFHNIVARAKNNNMTPSAYLNQQEGGVDKETGLDAFERMLASKNIAVRSDPAAGVYTAELSELHKLGGSTAAGKALTVELGYRLWRGQGQRKTPQAQVRAPIFTTSDYPVNSWANPYYDDPTIRESIRIEPQIPLSELVAMTTAIDGPDVRSFVIVNNKDDQHLARVNETAEIPRVKVMGVEREVKLRKYGRALEISYENMLRMRMDYFSYLIAKLRITAETDKVAVALNTIINGDGNPNTGAESFNLTALDPSTTANNLTLRAWLRFKMKFKNPYAITTALGQEDSILKLWLLDTGNANIPLVTIAGALGSGTITPINRSGDNVRVGWLDEAPAGKIVGFDRQNALHRWVWPAMSITEQDNFISNQTNLMTFTESEAFSVLDPNGNKILNMAA